MATTITNGNLDTLAAAVAAPYGPLTRVGSVASYPTPNSDLRVQFTSALSVTVHMSYDELNDPNIQLKLLKQYHDWTALVEDFKTAITDINTLAAAMSAPHTYNDYQSLVDEFREKFKWVWNFIK